MTLIKAFAENQQDNMRFLFKYLLPFILILVAGFAYFAYTEFNQFKRQTSPRDIASFEIKKGSTIRTVAKQLKNKNIIQSASLFTLLAKLNKQDTKIKAGEYALKAGLTPGQILDKFTQGTSINYQTQILEGKQFKDIVKTIRGDEHLLQTLSKADYENIMQKLKTDYKNLKPEGLFYPDTYNYPRGTTDLQFLQRSHDAMVKYIQQKWKNRKPFKGINTPYDALILASIVEKETGHPEDRNKIARVFLNRLQKDMLLQTDPTVIYGMGDKYQGNIRKKDLKADTPYNTYTRKGLPPTPIATPSKASIDAVFDPADGDMLYFVAKGNDGTSHFSKTYAEHKRAVVKYLLNGNKTRYQGDK